MRLDPKFALSLGAAVIRRCRRLPHEALQPTAALREEARQAAETALTLQPNLGEAICQGILPLRLPKGLRHRSALL